MNNLAINENHTIWLGLAGSLTIHGLLFAFSGTTFIPHAQFSVKPSIQTVEVSIEEKGAPSMVSSKYLIPQTVHSSFSVKVSEANDLKRSLGSSTSPKKEISLNKREHSLSSVQVKASPDYLQNPSPEYPELARQMRQEGLVLLTVDVNRAGDPVKVEIKQSCGYRLLDQAALKAVREWKFQPARIGNIPIESTVTVPIRFRLEK